MNKNEWIWVAIRIFGIYLLVLAVIAIPDAVGHVYSSILMTQLDTELEEISSMAVALRKVSMSKGLIAVCQVILFSIFSVYFLKYGKWIHKLASSENA